MNSTPQRSFDVLVVGSGAAGLTAALTAAREGATVAVLEKTATFGGTSALSGGMLWIPCNKLAQDAGIRDSEQQAFEYLETITMGRADNSMLRSHLRRGNALLDFLETEAGLKFSLVGSFPDYHPELPGGSTGGRSIEPTLFDINTLGDLAPLIRSDPRPPFLQREYFEEWRTYRNMPHADLQRRSDDGIVARGMALISPLVKALADRGVALAPSTPARSLLSRGGRVVGVATDAGQYLAEAGVILASGGFEWSDDLCRRFLSGPVESRCSVPANVGDGLRMAMQVGVDLANMSEAWWAIYGDVPGIAVDGISAGTILTVERSLPGSIIVNDSGERFTNESGSYYAIGKTLANFDADRYRLRNLPAFLIADVEFYSKYGFLGASDPTNLPPWVTTGDSLADLARSLEIDATGLERTVADFNIHAAAGSDPAFGRGNSSYDRYFGDAAAPHPNLAPLAEPPFFSLQIRLGAIGTKGGVRTDTAGRALDPWGEPIDGLFAVGNVAAHPIAFGYLGAGSTLGPGMTMAYAAGHAIASSKEIAPA